MKKLATTILSIFCIFHCQAQSAFQVLYPSNTSLTNPTVMTSYTDTANGKIVFDDWPFTANLTINSFNISNNNFPCGTSFPFPASKTVYLDDLYTGSAYAACYASGPLPDTIMFYLLDPVTNAKRDTMYFVVGGTFPVSVANNDAVLLTVSPNPAHDFIRVSELTIDDELTIYSMSGATLIKEIGNDHAARIDISSLPLGLYILELKSKSGSLRREKLLKE